MNASEEDTTKPMKNHISLNTGVLAVLAGFTIAGCHSDLPTGNPANDPAGLGTPQQRLEALKANTIMDPRLKARKMQIIQDEINGTNTRPGTHSH